MVKKRSKVILRTDCPPNMVYVINPKYWKECKDGKGWKSVLNEDEKKK